MCGIAGTYQQVDGEATARRMSDCLSHRGPDDAGLYSFVDDRVAAHLAHRRLSIIDLSPRAAADQPLVEGRAGPLPLQRRGCTTTRTCGPSSLRPRAFHFP